jgi:hypothetical protein
LTSNKFKKTALNIASSYFLIFDKTFARMLKNKMSQADNLAHLDICEVIELPCQVIKKPTNIDIRFVSIFYHLAEKRSTTFFTRFLMILNALSIQWIIKIIIYFYLHLETSFFRKSKHNIYYQVTNSYYCINILRLFISLVKKLFSNLLNAEVANV